PLVRGGVVEVDLGRVAAQVATVDEHQASVGQHHAAGALALLGGGHVRGQGVGLGQQALGAAGAGLVVEQEHTTHAAGQRHGAGKATAVLGGDRPGQQEQVGVAAGGDSV